MLWRVRLDLNLTESVSFTKISRLYPPLLYVIGLVIQLYYALSNNYTDSSDSALNYNTYIGIAQTGQWQPQVDNILSSCLTTTLFPAMLQRLTGIDPLLLFKVYSCVLIAFLPVIVYLIAKRYMKPEYAFIAALFIVTRFYFFKGPIFARIDIALLFFALALLVLPMAIRTWQKYSLLALLSVFIVISHYGTAFVSIFILGLACVILQASYLLTKPRRLYTGGVLILFICLVTSSFLWYSLFPIGPLHYGTFVVKTAVAAHGDYLNIGAKETVVYIFLGAGLKHLLLDMKMNFALFWFINALMASGLIATLLKKWQVDKEIIYIALASYIVIFLALLVTPIETYYGFIRIYFQAIVILVIFLVIGGLRLLDALRLPPGLVLPALYVFNESGNLLWRVL